MHGGAVRKAGASFIGRTATGRLARKHCNEKEPATRGVRSGRGVKNLARRHGRMDRIAAIVVV
jgi:hypothetical protein